MIIAVVAVWMVQVAIDQIVDVVAMRHWLVAAPRAVYMIWVVPFTPVVRRAGIGVFIGHLDDVLIHVSKRTSRGRGGRRRGT